jgi:hypothetical protein
MLKCVSNSTQSLCQPLKTDGLTGILAVGGNNGSWVVGHVCNYKGFVVVKIQLPLQYETPLSRTTGL